MREILVRHLEFALTRAFGAIPDQVRGQALFRKRER
jgi:hypothetical protein